LYNNAKGSGQLNDLSKSVFGISGILILAPAITYFGGRAVGQIK
jgi:hypothetical protein